MADVVRFLRALAAGLSAFGAVQRGEEEFRIVEDHPGEREFGDLLTAPNPWLTEDQSLTVYRVLRSSVDTYSVMVPTYPGVTFIRAREVLVASLCLVADEEQTRETVDKGLLFELARIGHYLFSQDTVPEEMWAMDEQLQYIRSDLHLPVAHEVRAFMDASFSGDLERAVKVADVVCSRGVELYKDPATGRPEEESNMRRMFAAILLMEMSGTLCAQITPSLVPDLDARPIGGTTSDPMEGWGADD